MCNSHIIASTLLADPARSLKARKVVNPNSLLRQSWSGVARNFPRIRPVGDLRRDVMSGRT